ncbi:MFS transporter [Nitrospirillum sp. BR 11164]|uniref:MFS transporter n=1 Tax=Nitrospirillum sp. BR 11164 TaxID=3104324 RepID=UPI002AFF199C|nr:MFS transporter [Nitrospirillum sp. BR 11164]MEA1652114.1 MFS transporter [Nitrospirillum sp. BR 11164]
MPDTTAPARHARAVTYLVAGAFFMELLDGTVIATAMPRMARSFGVAPVDMNIGMTAYLLALAVFIPISGWVADRMGPRTVFGGAIALFTLSSLLCGLSPTLWTFTAARVLQGLGGAAMVPVGRLIILRITEKKDLMRAIGTTVWPGLVAPVLGPPLGGFIVTYADWPWIFFLNLPLGLAALAMTVAWVPNERPADTRPLDVKGFLLSGAALVALVFGLDTLGQGARAPAQAVGGIALGLALSVLTVRHCRRHPAPLFKLDALRLPTYAIAVWGGSVQRVAIGTVPFLTPLLFQTVLGMDAFQSGTLVLCIFAGNLSMKMVTNQVLRRFGFRRVLLVNGVLMSVSLAACGLFTPDTPKAVVGLVLFLGGLFRSMQFTGLGTIQFADVPKEEVSAANTLAAMLGQLTSGLGVVAGALALNLGAFLRGHPQGQSDLTDFRNAFLVMGAAVLLSLYDAWKLAPDAAQNVSGHARRNTR